MVQSENFMSFQAVIDAYKFSELWDSLSEGSKVAYSKPLERLLALSKEWERGPSTSTPMQLPVAVAVARSRSLPSQAEWSRLIRSLEVSNAEKNKMFVVLNAVYQGAELGRMKFKSLEHTVEETTPWAKNEIETLWASPLPLRLRLAVGFLRFCFYSGLRPWCEAAVLRKDALAGEYLLVMGSKRREKGKVAGMIRILPEMQECLDFVAQMVPAPAYADLLWVNELGRPMQKDTVRKRLVEACSLAGVEYREMYDARRGLATSMLRAGYSLEEVANQLRHKRLETTKRYDQRTMSEKAAKFQGV